VTRRHRRSESSAAPIAGRVRVEWLSGDALLWGGEVTDERYAVVVPVR
jgi:hypothetical protein